jgi:hypothetical protein
MAGGFEDWYPMLMWIFAILFAAFACAFVYCLQAFVIPARKTFARAFIKAAKEKKHVFLAWAGNHWKFFVCDDQTELDGYWITETDKTVLTTHASIGMSMGNVKLAVGDSENMKQQNTRMADLIAQVAKRGITPEEMRAAVFAIERVKTKGEDPNAAYRDELAVAMEEGKYTDAEINVRLEDHMAASARHEAEVKAKKEKEVLDVRKKEK